MIVYIIDKMYVDKVGILVFLIFLNKLDNYKYFCFYLKQLFLYFVFKKICSLVKWLNCIFVYVKECFFCENYYDFIVRIVLCINIFDFFCIFLLEILVMVFECM